MGPEFDQAYEFIRKWEGEWSNDPKDPGGLTYRGVSIRAMIAKKMDLNNDGVINRKDLEMLAGDEERLKQFYWREYWVPSAAHSVASPLSLLVFDCGVNQGVSRAVRILQKTAGVKVDGQFGPITKAAIQKLTDEKPRWTMVEYQARRAVHYSSLAIVVRFGLGWFRRLFDGHGYAVEIWVRKEN